MVVTAAWTGEICSKMFSGRLMRIPGLVYSYNSAMLRSTAAVSRMAVSNNIFETSSEF